ncbi:hypothetical protein [Thalassospira indica]|nr:hypothetical protein [Thalassospira indica]OAZ13460.1 hypothetical protein TH15_10515 [Thalassospira profundimaris]
MPDEPKKKSPRSPSLNLEDALTKAIQLYEANHLHPVANDVAAQSMGYAGANNGASLSTLAALKYYGLVDRVGNGKLAASKDLETFQYAPNSSERTKILRKWLFNPKVFEDIHNKYKGQLPSDAAIKYDLIQMGFIPDKAEICLKTYKSSLEFVNSQAPESDESYLEDEDHSQNISEIKEEPANKSRQLPEPTHSQVRQHPKDDTDRIPVRLQGGRKAWLEIPTPFFKNDKQQLVKQIELLITDDDDGI